MSFETINLDVLQSLPVYRLPPTYTLQREPGNGCCGDPPGYPSYFTQNVYTRRGDSPPKGCSQVIVYQGVCYQVDTTNYATTWDKHVKTREALFHKLWLPLPLEHPRVQAWIDDTFIHLHNCYTFNKKIYAFVDGVWISPDLHRVEKYLLYPATDDNHTGTITIRQYYPGFKPTKRLLDGKYPRPERGWERDTTPSCA